MEKWKCMWRFPEREKIPPYKLSTDFADLRCMHNIHSIVMRHFERYNILTDHQYGFRSERS